MSQFIILAYDAKDEAAPKRRMDCREEHLQGIAKLREQGNALFGMAITDEEGKMIGSLVVTDFPSRAEFDAWFKTEPYVTKNVWSDVKILPGKLAPTFSDLLKKAA